MSIDRVGLHAEAVWTFVNYLIACTEISGSQSDNLIPSLASASKFGVLISPPKQPRSEYPKSFPSVRSLSATYHPPRSTRSWGASCWPGYVVRYSVKRESRPQTRARISLDIRPRRRISPTQVRSDASSQGTGAWNCQYPPHSSDWIIFEAFSFCATNGTLIKVSRLGTQGLGHTQGFGQGIDKM